MNQIIKKAKQIKPKTAPQTLTKKDKQYIEYTEVAITVINGELTVDQVAEAEKIKKQTAYSRIVTAPFHALRRGLITVTFNK